MNSQSNDSNVTDELTEMVTRYDKRKKRGVSAWKHQYYERARLERDQVFSGWLSERFDDCSDLRCLEIGAGSGKNIPSFLRFGVPIANITANELLEDRLSELNEAFPDVQTIAGNALEIEDGPYDIILISTVLSSILDLPFRRELSAHLLQQLSDRGVILWYDFSYQNPLNKDVSGIKQEGLPDLFENAAIQSRSITLTPPLALLIGPLYSALSWIPLLHSHVAAIISKT